MPSLMTTTKNVSIRSFKLRFTTEALIPELLLRHMNLQEISVLSFEAKPVKLKGCLIEEMHISNIMLALELGNSAKDSAMVLIEQAMLCQFHTNMRIVEKFTKLLLQDGLNNNIDNREAFVISIERFMNERVFGHGSQRV